MLRKWFASETGTGAELKQKGDLRVAPFRYPSIEQRDPLVRPRFARVSWHGFVSEAASDLVAPLLHIFILCQVERPNHATPLTRGEQRLDVQGEARRAIHVSLSPYATASDDR